MSKAFAQMRAVEAGTKGFGTEARQHRVFVQRLGSNEVHEPESARIMKGKPHAGIGFNQQMVVGVGRCSVRCGMLDAK